MEKAKDSKIVKDALNGTSADKICEYLMHGKFFDNGNGEWYCSKHDRNFNKTAVAVKSCCSGFCMVDIAKKEGIDLDSMFANMNKDW